MRQYSKIDFLPFNTKYYKIKESLYDLCLSVHRIAPKLFAGLTPNFAIALLMNWGCAFCAFGAIRMHAAFDISKKSSPFYVTEFIPLLPFWTKTHTAPLCLCTAHCGWRLDCICYKVNKTRLKSFVFDVFYVT